MLTFISRSMRDALVRALKAFRSSDRGTAAAELAMTLPLLALLAIGVADFGRMYFTGIAVANATRAGVQYGAQSTVTSGNFTGMEQAARNDAADLGTISVLSGRFCKCPDGSTPSCTSSCPSYGGPQVFVHVTASKTYSFLIAYPGLPSTIVVTRTATFRAQ
jgi:Flp pilus assembly protein TadG